MCDPQGPGREPRSRTALPCVVMTSRRGSSQAESAELAELIRNARRATPAELRAQRVSFAYGNVAIENPRITREMVVCEAARIRPRASR